MINVFWQFGKFSQPWQFDNSRTFKRLVTFETLINWEPDWMTIESDTYFDAWVTHCAINSVHTWESHGVTLSWRRRWNPPWSFQLQVSLSALICIEWEVLHSFNLDFYNSAKRLLKLSNNVSQFHKHGCSFRRKYWNCDAAGNGYHIFCPDGEVSFLPSPSFLSFLCQSLMLFQIW